MRCVILGVCLLCVQPSPVTPSKPEEVRRPLAGELARSLDPMDAPALERLLLMIAREHKTYARVSDRTQWAPALCRPPTRDGVQQSLSRDDATHGRKLYYMYALDDGAYDAIGIAASQPDDGTPRKPWTNPVGQIVVKESLKPELVCAGGGGSGEHGPDGVRPLPADQVHLDGATYRAGDPAGLFMMVKVDPKHAGTDDGWIYATTSPDGTRIELSGAISSCIDCHRETDRDRLYGPQWSWPEVEGKRLPPVRKSREQAPGAPPPLDRR